MTGGLVSISSGPVCINNDMSLRLCVDSLSAWWSTWVSLNDICYSTSRILLGRSNGGISSYKYLKLIIDNNLCFDTHVEAVCKKSPSSETQ